MAKHLNRAEGSVYGRMLVLGIKIPDEIKQARLEEGFTNLIITGKNHRFPKGNIPAKTQVEFLKAIPNKVKEQMNINEVKAIAGTLKDNDAELDVTLHEINEKKKKPYKFDNEE